MNGTVYCGRVEYNLDPEKIGRIRIRIPSKHGTLPGSGFFMPIEQLPWCYPCMPFFAGYDCGSFVVPPVGTYVWAIEVSGKSPYFVYFGGVYGTGPSEPKPMNTLNPDANNISMGQYFSPAGVKETPLDVDDMEYAQSGVIFKSPKGHTIKYSDQDGAEFFEFIDRSGHSIRMDCPVPQDRNKANASRRGKDGKQSGGSITITSGKSKIMMTDNHLEIYSPTITIRSDDPKKTINM